jgi:hypothetical protein
MRFKLSTLMRSGSQSEKGFGGVRVSGDASLLPALHVGRVVPPWAAYLFRFPLKHAYVWALLKPSKRALSLADGVIAFYDTKYTYNFWRLVTAIRGAALDGNLGTLADPNWLPEVTNTTPDPSYPGAHTVISAPPHRC